jgi:hypothetical protein
MQLLIKRTQRQGGMLGGKVIFILGIRCQYTENERADINRYKLGGEVIYNSATAKQYFERAGTDTSNLRGFGYLALAKMNLNVTIASLQQGHTIECKDLAELLECEEAIVSACKNIKNFLAAAATFDGREIVVDLDEQVAA